MTPDATLALLSAEAERLRAQLAKVEAARAVLLELLPRAAEPTAAAAPPPQAPPPQVPPPAEVITPGKARPGREPNTRLAWDIAAHLKDGPRSNADLSRLTGSDDSHTFRAMARRPEWFHRTGRGRGTKWELTEQGRREAIA